MAAAALCSALAVSPRSARPGEGRLVPRSEDKSRRSSAVTGPPLGDVWQPPQGSGATPIDKGYIALGVMSNPNPKKTGDRLRKRWREWAGRFASHQQGVQVRFVFGDSFYEQGKERGKPTHVPVHEQRQHGDFLVVDGRENLPNVGKVQVAWHMRVTPQRRRPLPCAAHVRHTPSRGLC